MASDRVIVVHLRRPRKKDLRDDPFWEFGSFGITGCHSDNLMHPKNIDRLQGVRLAFAQGGKEGTRLVHLTPPVKFIHQGARVEATWPPADCPFRYERAPILASNKTKGDFPRLTKSLRDVRRSTAEGSFASKYRTSANCVSQDIAEEIVRVYTGRRNKADSNEIASSYDAALPWRLLSADRDRARTYERRVEEARESKRKTGCPPRKRSRC